MKKEMAVLGGVTAAAMVVAAVGHATNPAICVAIKPMSWPFLALAAIAVRHLLKSNKKGK